ncbi:VOC family protein [Phenylobacterium koreense]|uniref:Glyoxalase superfamily protein PhnB n=1 Tax=Phenylobacterium koreense TaxID=266125 RepID=A0ABV2EMB2_9CAUL
MTTMESAAGELAAIDMPMKGVIPHLAVDGASAASEFYQKAFGAKEVFRLPADDGVRLLHCALLVNGGTLMICDVFPDMPEHGAPFQPSSSYTMHLQVDDIDSWSQRALDAGAEVVMPVDLMFWGDRYGILRDPFGIQWSMGEPQPKA